jgi:vacuolar-type H+-ATPase subunit H
MESSTEASVLAALEKAEMAARERRLAVSSEAEGIVSAARQRAATISSQAGRRIADALDELRGAAEAEADAATEEIERLAAGRSAAGTAPADADAAFEHAVAIVVAHVLGEASSEPASGERA